MDAPPPAIMRCAACTKLEVLPAPFKACGKCKTVRYCSIACQKTDWKTHKLVCVPQTASQQPSGASSSASTSTSASGYTSAPPTLSKVLSDVLGLSGRFFTDRHSKTDVFSQLIDAFRLRVSDEVEYKFNRTDISPETIASLVVSQVINDNNTRIEDTTVAGTGFDPFLDLAEKNWRLEQETLGLI